MFNIWLCWHMPCEEPFDKRFGESLPKALRLWAPCRGQIYTDVRSARRERWRATALSGGCILTFILNACWWERGSCFKILRPLCLICQPSPGGESGKLATAVHVKMVEMEIGLVCDGTWMFISSFAYQPSYPPWGSMRIHEDHCFVVA